MAQPPTWYGWRMAGAGSATALVSARLRLPRPARAILEVRKTVLVDRVDPVPDLVLVAGRVRVSRLITAGVAGREPVRDHTCELRFTVLIRVAGAAPGMRLTVTAAHVEADESLVVEVGAGGEFRVLLDRSLVRLSVRVAEWGAAGLGAAGRAAGPPGLGAARCVFGSGADSSQRDSFQRRRS